MYRNAVKTKHSQTKAPTNALNRGSLSLPMLAVSPYFSIGSGALNTNKMSKIGFIVGHQGENANDNDVLIDVYDAGVFQGTFPQTFTPSGITSPADLDAQLLSAAATFATANGLASVVKYNPVVSDILTAPTSYQTIVSQTGTAAPAVSGSLSPMNTYTAAFTWARTGVGVYTLTANSAVFNTSGKTSVFITPPQNLNGSFRAVVTSSTVITVTTAVQSLAVLGLLGFTTTNTDALLNNTMIYVQTYP